MFIIIKEIKEKNRIMIDVKVKEVFILWNCRKFINLLRNKDRWNWIRLNQLGRVLEKKGNNYFLIRMVKLIKNILKCFLDNLI